jgi:3'(2'), 5'-bisphosphate nucleotidase
MKSSTPDTSMQLSVGQLNMSRLFELADSASKAILDIYGDEPRWHQVSKSDHTPVTAADIRSSEILVAGLPGVFDCPVVSEEDLPPYERRSQWPLYWLVDPLDGTKEFIGRTGEFVINIALMHQNQPVFGFIYQVTENLAWWGGPEVGAYSGHLEKLSVGSVKPLDSQLGTTNESILALGSRRSNWKGEWRARLQACGYRVSTQSVGSALKFAYLAEGHGDLYTRLGPTSEWDTAAPQAILDATGGAVVQWNGQPLEYGKKNTLNPHFVAVRDKAFLKVLLENTE